jgi:peptidoglycan/LPS O-acetylase OafA/YrhL
VTKLGYVPALDGIRAIAIALVVVVHATRRPPSGNLGVDLFFVLSGFLITTILLEERATRGHVPLSAFYRRRALRLVPALVVMLGCFLLVSTVLALVRGTSLHEPVLGVAAGLGYFSNIVIAAGDRPFAMPSPIHHLWSLAEEEQFYLVWPLVLFVVLRGHVRWGLLLAAGAVVGSFSLAYARASSGTGWHRLFFVPTRTQRRSWSAACSLSR